MITRTGVSLLAIGVLGWLTVGIYAYPMGHADEPISRSWMWITGIGIGVPMVIGAALLIWAMIHW